MARITFKGKPIHTLGDLPATGVVAPDFTMVKTDLSEISLHSFGKKMKILNVFPSVDTVPCAMSVRKFNKMAAELPNVLVLNLSKDLPFAQKRFCGAEGIEAAMTASVFRSSFPKDYKLEITDGLFKGLCSRAVIVLDESNKVIYTQQVGEVTDEPDYEEVKNAVEEKLVSEPV